MVSPYFFRKNYEKPTTFLSYRHHTHPLRLSSKLCKIQPQKIRLSLGCHPLDGVTWVVRPLPSDATGQRCHWCDMHEWVFCICKIHLNAKSTFRTKLHSNNSLHISIITLLNCILFIVYTGLPNYSTTSNQRRLFMGSQGAALFKAWLPQCPSPINQCM